MIEPQAVVGDLRFLSVSVGDDVACGLTVDSLAYCWGGEFGPEPIALPFQR